MRRSRRSLSMPLILLGLAGAAALAWPLHTRDLPSTSPSAERRAGTASSGPSCLVQPPLEVELRQVSEAAGLTLSGGGTADLLLRIRPLIDAPSLRWSLALPSGVHLLSGEDQGTTALPRGQELSLPIDVAVDDGGVHELYARAEILSGEGQTITRGAGLTLDLGPKEMPRFPEFERTDATGRTVVTYKGEARRGGGR